MALDGKTFIITGGGSGLGAATARTFAAAGANVIVSDMNVDGANEVAGEIGDKARAIECNVTKEEDVCGNRPRHGRVWRLAWRRELCWRGWSEPDYQQG